MKRAFALILLALAQPVYAQDGGTDPLLANEQLADPAQELQAATLMETLRCIQCQGQSIADSDAPIAAAMRSEVRQRIQKGESTEAIRSWMISRYGEWVSFDPPMKGMTLLLWFMPLILLAAGLWMARGLFRKAQ
jgi:cytochrome c-type biogenesis protein CcmH/NrfF